MGLLRVGRLEVERPVGCVEWKDFNFTVPLISPSAQVAQHNMGTPGAKLAVVRAKELWERYITIITVRHCMMTSCARREKAMRSSVWYGLATS